MADHAVGQDALVGQRLRHYRIIEQIGSGGMGVVYRAHDEHLDREIAIKVLRPGTLADESRRKHFRKEALALSKLNHPNIATIHDFDTQHDVDFLVMEYIPGVTLNDKLAEASLPEKQVVALGVQLAEGLAAAHEHAVVHRDLKPGNLRITTDGRVKILDFGLAKLRAAAVASAASETLSETYSIAGTLPYMAPEQVLSGEVDARIDIYAAGAVLYEMVTGQRAFPTVDRSHLIGAILRSSPQPAGSLNPRLSPELSRIIEKCLEREPENRYQSAKELAIDLRRLQFGVTSAAQRRAVSPRFSFTKMMALGALVIALAIVSLFAVNVRKIRERLLGPGAEPHIESLAVLPLANLSGDPQQEYFADGMTEALIAELSQISSLKVISRTSAMHYKGSSKSLPEIARELNVSGIIEGSVLRSGDRVRISAQLIDASSDTHLWAKSYEEDSREVLKLQSAVAQAITSEIRAKVTTEERTRLAGRARPINPEAYELYLKGRYEWNKRSEGPVRKALDYFQQAIEVDPSYGLAYSGLADSYSVLGNGSILPGQQVYPKAKAAALKGLELDMNSAEAHTSLSGVLADYDRNWEGALRELQTAISLNPNYATAHHWYGMRLAEIGQTDEGVREIERARTLDPLSVRISANVVLALYFGRQYDQAIIEARKTLELEPNDDGTHTRLGEVYLQKGMLKEALAEHLASFSPEERTRPGFADTFLARAYAAMGNRTEALRQLRKLQQQSTPGYTSPFLIARVYVTLGETDEALRWLQKGFNEYAGGMDWLKVDPALDPIRSDPRFQDLMRRMNFPQ